MTSVLGKSPWISVTFTTPIPKTYINFLIRSLVMTSTVSLLFLAFLFRSFLLALLSSACLWMLISPPARLSRSMSSRCCT